MEKNKKPEGGKETDLKYSHLLCLSQSAAALMSHRRMVPLLLLYTKTLHWCGWHSAAVITSVSSSILAGFISTMSERGSNKGNQQKDVPTHFKVVEMSLLQALVSTWGFGFWTKTVEKDDWRMFSNSPAVDWHLKYIQIGQCLKYYKNSVFYTKIQLLKGLYCFTKLSECNSGFAKIIKGKVGDFWEMLLKILKSQFCEYLINALKRKINK